jgi:voltage-gated potassium channel
MAKVKAEARRSSWRGVDRSRVHAFIARHLLAWDVTMAGLALVYLGVGLVDEQHSIGPLTESRVAPVELAITAIFVAEFGLRFYVAPSRGAYLKGHWIDLLALLPAIRWLRFLRMGRALVSAVELMRLLRLGVLVRFLVELDRALSGMRRMAARHGVHVFLMTAVALVLIGGTVVWALEHTVNPSFHDYWDALWWAFATMTTVGYGNGPTTLPGRAIGAVVMILGIACFGVVTATVTAFFVERHSEEEHASPEELRAILLDIQARLERLERGQLDGAQPEAGVATLPRARDEQGAAF